MTTDVHLMRERKGRIGFTQCKQEVPAHLVTIWNSVVTCPDCLAYVRNLEHASEHGS